MLLVPLARLLFRMRIEGRHHIPRDGAVILAANHLSFIDSFIIPLVTPRPVSFLAKAEYFQHTGVKGWLIRASLMDAIAVPRGAHRAAQASLELALEVLNDGKAFGIHPEGSRSRDGRLYRGRTGVAWLALASNAPVVPVAVLGTDRVQPVGARFPRIGRRIIVRFGPPLCFPDPPANAARARRVVTDEIMSAIQDLSGQKPAHSYNELSAGVQSVEAIGDLGRR
jgi:1-acyl-sn-glycerol-3-phosphate acyltransferase